MYLLLFSALSYLVCRFDIGFAENAAAERQLAFCAGPVRSGRTAVSREVHKRHLGKADTNSQILHTWVWNTRCAYGV